MTQLIPHLVCRNADAAIAFYEKAFNAQNHGVMHGPDGKVMHAALTIDGAMFYLVEEFPDYGSNSPLGLGGSPVTLHLQVSDCDAVFNHAVESGCTVKMPIADMFWGDRYGMVQDPYGHLWSFATTIKPMSREEMQAAVTAAMENMSPQCGPDGATAGV